MRTLWIANYTLPVLLAMAVSSSNGNAQTFTTIDYPNAKSTTCMGIGYGYVGYFQDNAGTFHGFLAPTFSRFDVGTHTYLGGSADLGCPSEAGCIYELVGGTDEDGIACLNPGTGVCRAFFSDGESVGRFQFPGSSSSMAFGVSAGGALPVVGAYTRASDDTVHGFLSSILSPFPQSVDYGVRRHVDLDMNCGKQSCLPPRVSSDLFPPK